MTIKKYTRMFEPGKLGNITLPNRLVMAPMGVGHFGEYLEERLAEFYGERAKGGIGLILIENNYVCGFEEDPYPQFMPVPRFDSRRKISRAHEIARRIKMYGGVPGLQLGAGQGRNADVVDESKPPLSASPMPAIHAPHVMCREMTREDIKNRVDAFERAAAMALECEFQVLEIHAHSGYLVEQFLNKNINRRTDEYGGSAENRFRFAKEILEGVRAAVGDKMAVSIRMSLDHKCDDGITLEEGLEYCKLAEEAGYDVVHIDAGSGVTPDWTCPTPYMGKTPLRYLAKAAKEVVSIPVIAVGSYLMPEEVEDTLEAGDADFVALGRALLADPEWAKKVKLGKEDEIRGCIQCNFLCSEHCATAKVATCAVNPLCGRETELRIEKTDTPKRVTVVGGGPAGMVTALVAKKRGHAVTLLEQSGELGGSMKLICLETDKEGVRNYTKYMRRQIELSGIDVELNCDVTIEKIKATTPDVVVSATGSSLFIPNMPGFDDERVVTIKGLYDDIVLDGNERIVVVGGGVIGSEVALDLANRGHDVSVIELTDSFANGLSMFNRLSILRMMQTHPNLTMLANTACKGIENNELICENTSGDRITLPFDVVLVAVGMRAESTLSREIIEKFPEAYVIDGLETQGRIADAVHRGFFTGLRI